MGTFSNGARAALILSRPAPLCYTVGVVDLRFASAMQLMLSLALAVREGVPTMSSSELAEGLATNPSLVRKLLAPLVQAGLVASSKGKLGGVTLARPAQDITLADVYRAVLPDRKMFFLRTEIPHRCLVSSNIEHLFADISTELEHAVLGLLGARTLAGSLVEMQQSCAAAERAVRLPEGGRGRGRGEEATGRRPRARAARSTGG